MRNDKNNSSCIHQLTKDTPTIAMTGTPLNNSWEDLKQPIKLVTKDVQWEQCQEEERVQQLVAEGRSYYIAKLSQPLGVEFETAVVSLMYEEPEELVLQAAWSENHLASKQLTGEPQKGLQNFSKKRKASDMREDPGPSLPHWGDVYKDANVVHVKPGKHSRCSKASEDLVQLVDNFLARRLQPGSTTHGELGRFGSWEMSAGLAPKYPCKFTLLAWVLLNIRPLLTRGRGVYCCMLATCSYRAM